MSEHYNPQQPNYSLEDILAEFGSSASAAPPEPEEAGEPEAEAPAAIPIPQDPEKVEAIRQLQKRLEVRPQPKVPAEEVPPEDAQDQADAPDPDLQPEPSQTDRPPQEEAKAKLKEWRALQSDFVEQTGLKRQYDRERVGG